LRVAHPTDEDKNREITKVKNDLAKSRQSQVLGESAESDVFIGKPSTKGVPGKTAQNVDSHNPGLFNFDHCYDPALTPRKGWQQKVTHLETLYEQEREKVSLGKTDSINMKIELERQLLLLSTKLKESESQVDLLKDRLAQEERLKEDYHKQF
jgi:hypothetical protein